MPRPLAFLAGLVLATVVAMLAGGPNVPQCHEDEVLVGVGEFAHGRWSGYECGHAVDDYVGN